MAGLGRPFLFCRYSMYVGEEGMSGGVQFTTLQELQGKLAPHGKQAELSGQRDTLVMRPRRIKVEQQIALTWSVGQIVDTKVRAIYDSKKDDVQLVAMNDGSIRYSDFVAIPSLGVLAVDDRAGELHLGGRHAVNRFASVMELVDDEAGVEVTPAATPVEVRRALKSWSLTKFNFTIRPNNPRPVSRLAQEMSELLKKEGIAKLTGSAKPAEGGHMQMKGDGFITAANDLNEAGYGQVAVTGITEDGFEAEIKKPAFNPNRDINERIQGKPRELRVYIDDEGQQEEAVFRTAAGALIKFYTDEQGDGD
jgi:hypothetical protein